MKGRWREGSLRLRITPSELASLQKGHPAREILRLPVSRDYGWTVVVMPQALATTLCRSGSIFCIDLSGEDLARLSENSTEGVYFQYVDETGVTTDFAYYIEKDFPCVHPRPSEVNEAEDETFETPVDFEARKLQSKVLC